MRRQYLETEQPKLSLLLPSIKHKSRKENLCPRFQQQTSKTESTRLKVVDLQLPSKEQFLSQYFPRRGEHSPHYSLHIPRPGLHSQSRTLKPNKNQQQTYRPNTNSVEETDRVVHPFQSCSTLFRQFANQSENLNHMRKMGQVRYDALKKVVNCHQIKLEDKTKHLRTHKNSIDQEIKRQRQFIAGILASRQTSDDGLEEMVHELSKAMYNF